METTTTTAKFSSTCPICRLGIAVGSQVIWGKGQARHACCVNKTARRPFPPMASRPVDVIVSDEE